MLSYAVCSLHNCAWEPALHLSKGEAVEILTTVLRHMLGHWGLALTVGSGTGWATAGSARCAGSYAPAWALGWGRTRHTCCWKTGQPACVCSNVVEGHWTWHWAEPQAQTSCIHPVLPSSGTGGSHLTPSTLYPGGFWLGPAMGHTVGVGAGQHGRASSCQLWEPTPPTLQAQGAGSAGLQWVL